jgi:hypothetical protein
VPNPSDAMTARARAILVNEGLSPDLESDLVADIAAALDAVAAEAEARGMERAAEIASNCAWDAGPGTIARALRSHIPTAPKSVGGGGEGG